MDPAKRDPKNCSLDELIKADRQKKKAFIKKPKLQVKGVRAKAQQLKKGAVQKNNQRPANQQVQHKGGKTLNLKSKKTGIQKVSRANHNKPYPPKGNRHEQNHPPRGKYPLKQKNYQKPHPVPPKAHKQQQQQQYRAQNQNVAKELKPKKVLDKPRQEKPALRFSQTRLKVRNIDKSIVTNDDIRELFLKMGELVMCRFDYSDFGMFLGSATVQYKNAADAKKAIEEYHEGELDGKVITVEYDIDNTGVAAQTGGNQSSESKGAATIIPKQMLVKHASGVQPVPGVSGAVESASSAKMERADRFTSNRK